MARKKGKGKRQTCSSNDSNGTVPAPSITSSADAVLNTVELLEQILIHIPTKQLARLKIVCSTWRGVIVRSTKLRVELFLSPKALDSILIYPAGKKNTTPRISRESKELTLGFAILTINPLLAPTTPAFGNFRWLSGIPERRVRCALNTVNLLRLPHGPWENMLVSQPPCTKVTVSLNRCIWTTAKPAGRMNRLRFSKPPPSSEDVTIADEEGVCLRAVLNAIRESMWKSGDLFNKKTKIQEASATLVIEDSIDEASPLVARARANQS